MMDHEDAEFPFRMMHVVMRRVGDGRVRLALLHRAIEAWRNAPPYDPMRPPGDELIQLFQSRSPFLDGLRVTGLPGVGLSSDY